MKVLHFFKTAYPDSMGGTQQVIHQIATGVLRYGIETDVLFLSKDQPGTSTLVDGYRVHRVRENFEIASTGFSWSAISRFRQLAREVDLIHYHFPWPFMDLVHFLTRVKKPTVVSYHSDIIRQKSLFKLYRPLMLRFLHSVDTIVAASPNYLASSEVLTQFTNKVQIIPYGLDQATYPEPTRERMKQWREVVGDKFFLFVGVLRYYKGLHVLLDAARGLDFPIVILGAGPIEHELKQKAEKLGLKHIIFLGYLSDEDKVALLNLSYAVVFPSHLRSEAFGISLLEAAMFGKPMISSEIGTGTTFVNIADKTGVVVPPSDPVALGQGMRYLWENPITASDMGRRAKERFMSMFTADIMVNQYVNLYRQLSSDCNSNQKIC